MSAQRLTAAQRRDLENLALSLVENCVRNTQLENLHAGITPSSQTGDYSDVKVVSPYGEIPWTKLSRISDEEMKSLMMQIVDRVYTFLRYPEDVAFLSSAQRWKRPQLDRKFLRGGRRLRRFQSGQ
jgi:hypothetical protein